MSRKWSNLYQNEVDEEIKGVASRDKVIHNEMIDQLLLESMMMVANRGGSRTSSLGSQWGGHGFRWGEGGPRNWNN